MKPRPSPRLRISVVLLTVAQLTLAPIWTRAQQLPDHGSTPAPMIVDVRLDEQGRLPATVVDVHGAPRAGLLLEVRQTDGFAAQTVTDQHGRAAVALERGGVFLVVAGNGAALCRVWTRAAAPPSAQDGVLIVEQDGVVQGQSPTDRIYNFFEAYPLLAYTLTAAAITLPIVLIAGDDDDES